MGHVQKPCCGFFSSLLIITFQSNASVRLSLRPLTLIYEHANAKRRAPTLKGFNELCCRYVVTSCPLSNTIVIVLKPKPPSLMCTFEDETTTRTPRYSKQCRLFCQCAMFPTL